MNSCKLAAWLVFILLYGLIVFYYVTKEPMSEVQQATQEEKHINNNQSTDIIAIGA